MYTLLRIIRRIKKIQKYICIIYSNFILKKILKDVFACTTIYLYELNID